MILMWRGGQYVVLELDVTVGRPFPLLPGDVLLWAGFTFPNGDGVKLLVLRVTA